METEGNKPSVYLTNLEEVKQVFNRFDVNGDGKISAAELVDVMKALGSNTSLDEVNRIMADIDTDCDGFISLEEFAGFCKGKSGEEDDGGMKELQDAFDLYDLNKNGLISAKELHQILSQLGEKCTVNDCTNMIKSVDSDGDGYVNFEEFKKMMSNNPSK
ncbi:calcium-binding allergen Ole e 8-like [Cynara cardunculus var. scolymus]|uniref:calcium-binding allergen Ole e 8-like n=1 Tax=Cynara cardunculus var. scolymus TaxID=59895 RepID=UPI000D62660C|nr:calcium-binding allergen Ole e 8-like [Cynara cardunculus var. scolymus]